MFQFGGVRVGLLMELRIHDLASQCVVNFFGFLWTALSHSQTTLLVKQIGWFINSHEMAVCGL
jgi:hypothetical protein